MPLIRSWLPSANEAEGLFPVNNLPYGVFSDGDTPRCGVAIGDQVLDLAALEKAGLIDAVGFDAPELNSFMERGPEVWAATRTRLTELLSEGGPEADLRPQLHPMDKVDLHLPFRVSEYTDFYAGRNHASNVGTMFRGPENALPPNWLHMPIGYNGRASSVVVDGTPVRRPWGQLKGPNDEMPRLAPSERFDYELELGAVVGIPSSGPVSVAQADAMIFGYVLLNDWSARDIQAWEYVPLGPFQAKATATTISPWVVPAAALEPFRRDAPARELPLLPHLEDDGPAHFDIPLEVTLTPEGGAPHTITRTNADQLYFSFAQQLCHHASAGCPMRVGDLLGSGTISGAEKEARGSMLELSWGGKEPLTLGNCERSFLKDGDRLTLKGAAEGDGYRIGFGEAGGVVLEPGENPWG